MMHRGSAITTSTGLQLIQWTCHGLPHALLTYVINPYFLLNTLNILPLLSTAMASFASWGGFMQSAGLSTSIPPSCFSISTSFCSCSALRPRTSSTRSCYAAPLPFSDSVWGVFLPVTFPKSARITSAYNTSQSDKETGWSPDKRSLIPMTSPSWRSSTISATGAGWMTSSLRAILPGNAKNWW